MVSPASALASATRSCESRDRRRTRRPSISSGPTISGISTTIISVSIGLVATSITSEPSSVSVERSVIEMPTPEIDCTSVVSAVSRDSTSPVRVTSKNVGSMRMTLRVHGVAHVGDDALAEPRDEIEAQRRERAEHDGRREEQR